MARQKRQPGDEPIAPPTLASGWDPCSWLNPGHIQCLRVGVVGSPKRWFCGWHYQVRRNPSIECFEEFERWLDTHRSYCCTETHYRASYLWALSRGESVPTQAPFPCENASCSILGASQVGLLRVGA